MEKALITSGVFWSRRISEQYRIVISVVAAAAVEGATVIYSEDPHT
jgi:Txe/YoeB family toxin of Txe-Axe toxin-antitoxin module